MVIQFENFIQFLFFTSDAWDYLNGNVFLRYKGIILCVYINIILKIGFRRVFRRYMRKYIFFFNTDKSFKKQSICDHV